MGTYQTSGSPAFNKNCTTGKDKHFYQLLKESIVNAIEIDLNVSFLMLSGVDLILEDLKFAAKNQVPIRILCSNYLSITQPEALYRLKDALGDNLDLRFYNVTNHSFHAKAYFFRYTNYEEVFVGSSNLSKSALTTGIEWNYRINSKEQREDLEFFKKTFENLWANFSTHLDDAELKKYAKQWIRPQIYRQIEESNVAEPEKKNRVAEEQTDFRVDSDRLEKLSPLIAFPQPIGAQVEALYALKIFRQENLDKGLIVAATGIGKTFLAAFDSRAFNRILFVAHREEILSQARESFKCVRMGKTMGQFDGSIKDTKSELIFASVQTLGNKAYLDSAYFSPDAFDYIIIDEFHHAVSDYYQNIIDYFTPQFLLGLTATPERLDNQDVFALCDYNVVYEVRLKEAINRGWLVPFRYYGIYDEMDYEQLHLKNGRYDEKELEQLASVNRRGNLIFQHYAKYKSNRALGFCINRRHALYMTRYFREQGISCCAVISGLIEKKQQDLVCDRKTAIKNLKIGKLQVIFSVDMLNEGLDIPELDAVLFLRPTESPTVFLQQLGRGLRKTKGKNYVNVLDFIGNYKKANLLPFLLTSETSFEKTGQKRLPKEEDYPEGCLVDFDFRLIDLFKKMDKDQKKIKDLVQDEFDRIRELCKRRPNRLDMFVYLDETIYSQIRSKKELNFFRDYLNFLNKIGETSLDEKALIDTFGHRFLINIENTLMSKTYKMPVFLAFYNDGDMKMKVSEEDLAESFKVFYTKPSNRIDLLRDKSTATVDSWGDKDYIHLANKNPVHFLSKSSGDFFYKEDDAFCLASELSEFTENPVFLAHFKDIIGYRTKRFYKERLEKMDQ